MVSKHFGVGAIVGRNEINEFATNNGFQILVGSRNSF